MPPPGTGKERGPGRGLQPTASQEGEQEGAVDEGPCRVFSSVLRTKPERGGGEDLTAPLLAQGRRDEFRGDRLSLPVSV